MKCVGLIDRYVARLFALSYLSAFFLVIGLFLIVDMAVNLDEFLSPDDSGNSAGTLTIARYYALRIPFLYLEVSPYVTLLAGMFTAAKLTRYKEVVAVLNAGVSARRLFAPVIIGAVLLAVGMFVLREWATKEIGARRSTLQYQLEEGKPFPVYENFWVRSEARRKVHLREYSPASPDSPEPEIRGLTCQYREDAASISIVAARATPLSGGRWKLIGGDRTEADESSRRPSKLDVLDEVRFTPDDVELAWKGRMRPMELSFTESRRLLDREPGNSQYRTLFHYHITFPLAGIALLLVGLPFVVGQERGKAGERIAKGFFLCVVYFGVEFVARTLGLQGQIGPLYASWVPVLGFGALGVVLFSFMRS